MSYVMLHKYILIPDTQYFINNISLIVPKAMSPKDNDVIM